jgi:hypothetical protein
MINLLATLGFGEMVQMRMDWLSRRSGVVSRLAIVGVSVALAACDNPAGSRVGPPEPALNFQRILVADAQEPSARLVALHNDSVVQTFTLASPATRVYRTGSGRFAAVQQQASNRVQFVDGGIWQEDRNAHRRDAGVLSFQLQDGRPADENVMGDWVSIFFDGSGMVRWLRESDLASGNPRITFEANSGRPHHGVSMTVLAGSTPFFVHSVANDAGSPTGVAVRNQQGQVVTQVAVGDCPGVHGNSAIVSGGVIGCNNGMVLVRPSGSSVTAQKITLTGDMTGLALRNAYAAAGASFIVGQFAAFPGQPAQRVFAIIDPATGAVNRLPALPTGVSDHWRAVEPVNGQVVLLGTNGALYVFDGSTRQLQHSVPNVVPPITSGASAHQFAVAENLAAVASPTRGEVVLVDLRNGSVTRRITVGGAPSRLALLGVQSAGDFSPLR